MDHSIYAIPETLKSNTPKKKYSRVRTLEDMSEEEIKELEKKYGCKVIRGERHGVKVSNKRDS
jgi:hypothetical protein